MSGSSKAGASTGKPSGKRKRALPSPTSTPAALRTMTSRKGGSAVMRMTQPVSSVNTATANTTANQIRTYSGRCNERLGVKLAGMALVLLFGEHVAHTAHGQDTFGKFGIVFNGCANTPHVHVDGTVKRFELFAAHRFHDLVA